MTRLNKAKKKFVRVVEQYAPRNNFISGIFISTLIYLTFGAFAIRDKSLELVLPKGLSGLFEVIIVFLVVAVVGIIAVMFYAQTEKGTVYPDDNEETPPTAAMTEDVAAVPSATETVIPSAKKDDRASDTEGSARDPVVSMPQPTRAAPDASGHRDQGRAGAPKSETGRDGSDQSRQQRSGERPASTTSSASPKPATPAGELPSESEIEHARSLAETG